MENLSEENVGQKKSEREFFGIFNPSSFGKSNWKTWAWPQRTNIYIYNIYMENYQQTIEASQSGQNQTDGRQMEEPNTQTERQPDSQQNHERKTWTSTRESAENILRITENFFPDNLVTNMQKNFILENQFFCRRIRNEILMENLTEERPAKQEKYFGVPIYLYINVSIYLYINVSIDRWKIVIWYFWIYGIFILNGIKVFILEN